MIGIYFEAHVENNAKNAAVCATHQKEVSVKEVIEEEDTVTEFANKMRLLEEAVSRGDLDLQQQTRRTLAKWFANKESFCLTEEPFKSMLLLAHRLYLFSRIKI